MLDGTKMVEIKTSNGNTYEWDDEIGLLIPSSNTMKLVINEISNNSYSNENEIIKDLLKICDANDVYYYHSWMKKLNGIKNKNHNQEINQDITTSNIREYLLRTGYSQLILGVTEACNFRCKYCAYSDNYEYSRNHSENYMDFKIAKKAIDYYMSLIDEGCRYNPLRKPVIGFYGGEPLLNFRLIKKCVEYVKRCYENEGVKYHITTNGSLLDREKADYLMDHDFVMSISIDGPEDEHNRNRLYKNGNGTFKDVMKNVRRIIDVKYENISSMPVIDWKSDLFKLEYFFNRDDVPPVSTVTTVSTNSGCRYYEQFTEKDKLGFRELLKKARDHYFKSLDFEKQNERPSFFYKLFNEPLEKVFLDCVSIYSPPSIMPFTDACVPGLKLFLDVRGEYHACEKLTSNHPIGNVNEGLNYEKIGELMRNYLNHMDKCQNCKVKRRCFYCYLVFENNVGFSYSSEFCKEVESKQKTNLSESITIAEINPRIVEENSVLYKNIKKYYGD